MLGHSEVFLTSKPQVIDINPVGFQWKQALESLKVFRRSLHLQKCLPGALSFSLPQKQTHILLYPLGWFP